MGDHLAYSRANYYADWVTIPILCLIALFTDVSYHGISLPGVLPLSAAWPGCGEPRVGIVSAHKVHRAKAFNGMGEGI